MTKSVTKIGGAAIVSLLALASLAACGDDSKTASSATTAAAMTDTTAAAMADTTAAAMADTTAAAMTDTTAAAMADTTAAAAPKDIVDTAVAAGSFTTLAKLLTAAGLVDTLKGAGPFTVFAPTDAAFAAVPAATLDALGKDIPKLKKVLTYHVVSGKVMAADVKAGAVKTVEGDTITLGTTGGVTVNDAKVTQADIVASNGVIHVIDKVLLPPGI
jgi:uncharacterized surface protein with fasciclin (FAS1) repeats